MMSTHYFTIAGFTIAVTLPSSADAGRLLPSFRAFRADGVDEGGLLFTLTVGQTDEPQQMTLLEESENDMGRLRLYAYFDYARFAWPRYRVSLPSQAFDNAIAASYTADRWRIDARYRVRHRQRDNADKTALRGYTDRRLRLALTLGTDKGAWNSRTQVDAAQSRSDGNDLGLMVSQSAEARWRWLRLYAFAAWFATDSYDSRLYAYERGPLYTFSFPAYYGRGVRYALMASADIWRNLTLTAKAGVTDYLDRSTIGSGLRRIDGSSMADIDVQLRWKF